MSDRIDSLLVISLLGVGFCYLAFGIYSYVAVEPEHLAKEATKSEIHPIQLSNTIQLEATYDGWYPLGHGSFVLEVTGDVVLGSIIDKKREEHKVVVTPNGWDRIGDNTAKCQDCNSVC